jgi:tryptophan 2,3-dioxygenase
MRISRYFDMLTTFIMEDGMEVDQYMKFRNTLTPASGFQSAQYRLIEFSSTDLINLIDNRFRDSSIETLLTNMLLNIYIGKRQVKTMQRVKSHTC